MSALRRILYLWLPMLPTDRIFRLAQAEVPTVTSIKANNVMRVAACNQAAQDAKLYAGMPLTDAGALIQNLEIYPSDPAAERKILLQLAGACERFTPFVALGDGHDLILDISGCSHLFGGEGGLVQKLCDLVGGAGIQPVVAVADHLSAAWAVARYGSGGIVPKGEHVSAAADLPLAALRLPAETVAVMARLGLKTVADVLAQPRGPLVHRFGPLVARRIDQLTGLEDEPISPLRPAAAHIFDRAFAEPVEHVEPLKMALSQLSAALAEALSQKGMGTRRFVLRLFYADGTVSDIAAGASTPIDDPHRIARLLVPRLEAMPPRSEAGSGIDLMRIQADDVEEMGPQQGRLGTSIDAPRALADLIDTLSERLGVASVYRLAPVDTHIPGRQTRRVPAFHALNASLWPQAGPRRAAGPLRPLRLLDPPELIHAVAGVPDGPPARFQWRRVFYQVAFAEGPERIAPEWWREEEESYDYFRVEDLEGRGFWLFRKGLYERETSSPRWFMHGLFG